MAEIPGIGVEWQSLGQVIGISQITWFIKNSQIWGRIYETDI
jgi:hypothetical protein